MKKNDILILNLFQQVAQNFVDFYFFTLKNAIQVNKVAVVAHISCKNMLYLIRG